MNFSIFKQAVAKQFATMQAKHLFDSAVSGDELWNTYLAAFPAGTNPIYRTRTEHDCDCCKQFIRTVGGILAISDGGRLISIWDIEPTDTPYDLVAADLSYEAKKAGIANVYRHYERTIGTDKNFEQLLDGQKTWEHFHVHLPPAVIASKDSIPTLQGQMRTAKEMIVRSLDTISDESVDTILELIEQNSLYRGEEHKHLVTKFKHLKARRSARSGIPMDIFAWNEAISGTPSVNAIRNSVIGTLLVDLSEGVPMERAVASFEAKVAPTNYKRPTALVTKSMIDAAKKKIEELGLVSSLERRYATIDDIKINDILFASSTARRTIRKDVFEELSGTVRAKPKADNAVEMSIEKFITDILPTTRSLEILIENRHAGNLVSLIAPVDPTAPGLFKWNNGFSWSYNGDMADSIKERVKAAGGDVSGELCCRLAWDYIDDLDFHMYEPYDHIHYAHRRSTCGGQLDVDANASSTRTDPVENIFYRTISSMPNGKYELDVHNFRQRSVEGRGFEVEIDLLGTVTTLSYDNSVKQDQRVPVATITKTTTGITIHPHLPSTQTSKSMWGISTHTFVPVTLMMLSPNHWADTGSGIGNKHYFFALDGCRNDGSARGFFNEFLKPELDPHRKVIEMVGSKLKTELSDRQLSGVGFSSTQRNTLTCRVTGSFTRTITLTF